MKRAEQREHIFKILFGVEFNAQEELDEQIQLYFEILEDVEEKDRKYMADKVLSVAGKVDEIDAIINEHATGWKTKRMNKVDLSIIRLAVYEMKWDEDVPVSVAINEAVVLAKTFGGDDSSSFVNGVLGKIAKAS